MNIFFASIAGDTCLPTCLLTVRVKSKPFSSTFTFSQVDLGGGEEGTTTLIVLNALDWLCGVLLKMSRALDQARGCMIHRSRRGLCLPDAGCTELKMLLSGSQSSAYLSLNVRAIARKTNYDMVTLRRPDALAYEFHSTMAFARE